MERSHEMYRWHYGVLARACAEALSRNRFRARVFHSAEEVQDALVEECEKVQTIGFGGSLTVASLKARKLMKGKGKEMLNHGLPGLTPEERQAIRLGQLTCDLFLTSTNAVTLDGKLVNIDGTGNRVNAMAFGPKKVIVVAGGNKIVKDAESGVRRIKDFVAPMNAKRLGYRTPCAETGICSDCDSPQRICNVVTVMEKKPSASNIEVYLVAESLGL